MTKPDLERIPDPDPEYWAFWVRLSDWSERTESWLRSRGGIPFRFGLRGFWAVIALIGLVLLMGPAINKPLTLKDIVDARDTATEQWIAKDFAAEYRIGTSPDGSLHAEVKEHITALFDGSHNEYGIQRVLATQYQGHALSPSNITATIDGKPVDVIRTDSPDRVTLSINGESALSGTHNFVLQYTMENLAYVAEDERREKSVDFLQWDVFGSSWPQGLENLNVEIILPQELAEQLIRAPRASMVWLIAGDGITLTPERDDASGDVIYQFSNNLRTLPPHSQASFTMSFEPGTFTMPAPNAFYWVQVFGPVIPLLFLLMMVLFTLAARAVAWSDERGRPWFVAQFDPPPGITPKTAAQILGEPASMELAGALSIAQEYKPRGSESRAALISAAKVARRTGRVGNTLWAVSRYLTAPERNAQIDGGLRKVPSGFVRDFFLLAPIALTIVQWGLVRQISYQATGAVLWWPFSIVVASTLVSALILGITLTQRPLTVKGALVKQHLLGNGEFATRTSLVERGGTKDPLLPYAALFGRPRATGRSIAQLIEEDLGEPGVSKNWLTRGFYTWPQLFVRAFSVLAIIGAVVAVSTPPSSGTISNPASSSGAIQLTSVMGITLISLLIGAAGTWAGIRRRRSVLESGVVRDLVRWFGPSLTVVALIGFLWIQWNYVASDPRILVMVWMALFAILANVAAPLLTLRSRGGNGGRRSGPSPPDGTPR